MALVVGQSAIVRFGDFPEPHDISQRVKIVPNFIDTPWTFSGADPELSNFLGDTPNLGFVNDNGAMLFRWRWLVDSETANIHPMPDLVVSRIQRFRQLLWSYRDYPLIFSGTFGSVTEVGEVTLRVSRGPRADVEQRFVSTAEFGLTFTGITITKTNSVFRTRTDRMYFLTNPGSLDDDGVRQEELSTPLPAAPYGIESEVRFSGQIINIRDTPPIGERAIYQLQQNLSLTLGIDLGRSGNQSVDLIITGDISPYLAGSSAVLDNLVWRINNSVRLNATQYQVSLNRRYEPRL